MSDFVQPIAGSCGPIGIRWGAFTSIGFAPDGRLAIANGPVVSILDAEGREVARHGFPSGVSSTGFLPDGRLVALVEGRALHVFDANGSLSVVHQTPGAVFAHVSSRGNLVGLCITTQYPQYTLETVSRIDPDTGVAEPMGGPPGLETRASRAFFASDITRAGGIDWWGVRLIEPHGVRELRIDGVGCAALVGERILIGRNDGQVRSFTLAGELVATVSLPNPVLHLEAEGDVALAMTEKECVTLDADAGVTHRMKRPRGAVWTARRFGDRIAFVVSRNGDMGSGLLRRWVVVQKLGNPKPVFATRPSCAEVTAVVPTAQALFVAAADGAVRRFDPSGGGASIDPKVGDIEAMKPAGDALFVLGARGLARVDTRSLAVAPIGKRPRCDSAELIVREDGAIAAAGETRLDLFDTATGEIVGNVTEIGPGCSVELTRKSGKRGPGVEGEERTLGQGSSAWVYRCKGSDATQVVAASFVKHALLTLHESGVVQRFEGPRIDTFGLGAKPKGDVVSGAFDPAGDHLVACIERTTNPRVYSARTGALVAELATSHPTTPTLCAWRGDRIVTAGRDRRLSVIDARSRRLVAERELDGPPIELFLDEPMQQIWLVFGASFESAAGTAALGEIQVFALDGLSCKARMWLDGDRPDAALTSDGKVEWFGGREARGLAVLFDGAHVQPVPDDRCAVGVLASLLGRMGDPTGR